MPFRAMLAARGPHLALRHDKKVRGVAGRHRAVYVEHERLVRPGLERLDEGDDLMQFAVAVELGVERVGRRGGARSR